MSLGMFVTLTSNPSRLRARQLATGEIVWELKLPTEGRRPTMAIEADLVFVATSEGDLFCVEYATGQPRWRQRFHDEAMLRGEPLLFVVSDRLIVTKNGRATCFDFAGVALWTQYDAAVAIGVPGKIAEYHGG